MTAATLDRSHRRVALIAAALVVAMVGLGYASVPLYDMFCRVTGFDGTTARATVTEADSTTVLADKPLSIRFDSNVDRDLPWDFRPEHPKDTVSIGARDMAIFIARNNGSEPITGTASFNVTPVAAGKYFKKIQCFCFTEQVIQPGEQVRMPVLYFVDPKLLDDPDARDIEEITLSYTFHRSKADGEG
ncbi:MAG: cytochrome c oxidase assembly protein [Sphingomonadales bacterium]|nr:cytochrome c oxidase assembly protein [Sphingomonadales bacterium]